jgi:hypothetical protein
VTAALLDLLNKCERHEISFGLSYLRRTATTQGVNDLESEKEAMDANGRIVAGLKAQGFDVEDSELERLARVLSGIANDLSKLDALKSFECTSTPGFRVEEADDDAG